MSWLFSQALAVEYSADTSLAGEQCALWSETHTPPVSWLPGRTTDACRLSRSGMMYAPLTEGHGEAVLMSFLEAFPARTLAQPEGERGSQGQGLVCGRKWRELSVKYDRDSSGWKTHQCLFPEVLPWSSVTLPKWGMMRDGVLWERTMPARLTRGIGVGSWPTPNQRDWKDSGPTQGNRKSPNLGTMVHRPPLGSNVNAAMTGGATSTECTPTNASARRLTNGSPTPMGAFPTPTASMMTAADMEQARYAGNKGGNRPSYQEAKQTWPTPSSNNGTGGCTGLAGGSGNRKKLYRMLGETEGKKMGSQALNPNWVEWLMGWPLCWTTLGNMPKEWIDDWHEKQQRQKASAEDILCGEVCSLWFGSDPASSSPGWELYKQPIGEYPSPLPSVPLQSASDGRKLGEGTSEEVGLQNMPMRVSASADQKGDDMQKQRVQEGTWPNLSRVAVGQVNRVDRLRAIGNGQVPQAMALAWEILTTP
jgi:hypothetical protein